MDMLSAHFVQNYDKYLRDYLKARMRDLAGVAASLNSSWGANPRFNTALRTPPATFTYENPSTGDSSLQPTTLPTEANKMAPTVDTHILSELHGNLFLVKTDVFIRNFLYGQAADLDPTDEEAAPSVSNSERRARDEKLAQECLEALRSQNNNEQFQKVVKILSTDENCEMAARISPYRSNEFTKLVENIRSKRNLYHPLADLFSFINMFFRCYFNHGMTGEWSREIDRSWPFATDPRKPSENHSTFLRRRFIVSYDKEFKYSPHVSEHPKLQPNLSLVLCKKLEGEWIETDNPHWKDVKVPIEVKLSDGFDANHVCQMARYARAIRLEQFDRNFTFSILISKNKCRVFHWDASRCHVTEVDIHKNPVVFIQIIGRLASMDPQSMGYDPRFSNSGRVLSTDNPAMQTWLEVIPAMPTKFHELPSRVENEGKKPLVLDLFIDHPIFQARGFLFSRFTRVWGGREVIGTNAQKGKLRVVKQNWADADRVNEAFLYEKAKDVPNVARLMGYEGVARTVDTCSLWNDGEIVGVYRKGGAQEQPLPQFKTARNAFVLYPCDESPRAFIRVLVRMIFEEKGRSILGVRGCRELLEATKQWVIGIWGLNEKGIIHRDVSSGNLLLGHDPGSPAFIIDLGLAHWSGLPGCEEDSSTPGTDPERVAKAHHHLTGTLPFIAYELLVSMIEGESIKHEARFDVESVLWVVLYVVLREERSVRAEVTLRNLLSTEIGVVQVAKESLLSGGLEQNVRRPFVLTGRFKDLAPFLRGFASLLWSKGGTLELDDVIDLIDSSMSSLPPGSGEKGETSESKRGLASSEDQEERVDGTSHERSGNPAKKMRSGQGVRGPVPE
ncbi:hypothetical protein FRC04_010558 [Tulasnella sp. 424]|nr:hypothetical protein FRC04_010558 [Tulasnella sp. 424]